MLDVEPQPITVNFRKMASPRLAKPLSDPARQRLADEKDSTLQSAIGSRKSAIALRVFAAIVLSAATCGAGEFLRVVEPVRLAPGPGEQLTAQVARTREILSRFQKAGFTHALWVVDRIPTNQAGVIRWSNDCLKAFPMKPIVALDLAVAEGSSSNFVVNFVVNLVDKVHDKVDDKGTVPAEARLKDFLTRILPYAHSVVLNWDRFNNYDSRSNLTQAAQAVLANARVVRGVSPKTFLWLRVDDPVGETGDIQDWVKPLADSIDGFWLERWHEWNAANEHPSSSSPSRPLRTSVELFSSSSPKPILRGGFRYSATRPRPALLQDMAENYAARLPVYEKWVIDNGYAGYSRAIGDAIPENVSPNQDFLGVGE